MSASQLSKLEIALQTVSLANIFSILSFIVFLASFGLAFYVRAKNGSSRTGKILTWLCVSFAVWSLGVAFLLISDPLTEVWVWYYLSSFGFFSIWPIIIHLFMELIQVKNHRFMARVYIISNYAAACLLELGVLLGNGVPSGYTPTPYGLRDIPDTGSFVFWAYSILLIVWFLSSFALAAIYKIRSSAPGAGKDERRRSLVIFYTGLVSGLLAVSFNNVMPALGINFPAIGSAVMGIWIFGFVFATTRYNFGAELEDIIGRASFRISGDAILVTAPNLVPLVANAAFFRNIGYEDTLGEFSLPDIILPECSDCRSELLSASEVEGIILALRTEQGRRKLFKVVSTFIYNDGDLDRILFVLTDVTVLKDQNEALDLKVRERTGELEAVKNEAERRLVITEKYTRHSLVKLIENGVDPTNIEPVTKDQAILFADIRQFTTISERLTPQEIIELLNNYFNEMNVSVVENGGEIDKLIGDCVMALFPDAEASYRAAMHMRRQLPKLNRSNFYRLDMGTGIDTGSVVVGNIGSESKIDFTVIGSHVNCASRLESMTKHYGAPVLITEAVKDAISPDHCVRFVDRVLIKGSKKPVDIYEAYDYQDDSLIALKKSYQSMMDEAWCLYAKGDFDRAHSLYANINNIVSSHKDSEGQAMVDPVAACFMNRCAQYRAVHTGEQSAWQGVFSFNS